MQGPRLLPASQYGLRTTLLLDCWKVRGTVKPVLDVHGPSADASHVSRTQSKIGRWNVD